MTTEDSKGDRPDSLFVPPTSFKDAVGTAPTPEGKLKIGGLGGKTAEEQEQKQSE